MKNLNLDELFLLDQSHQSLIQTIYLAQRQQNGKISLNYLCQRAGIPSKGYLSDVMRGKRKLNLKYTSSLGRALGLTRIHLKMFTLMVKRDHARKASELEKNTRDLMSCKKILQIQYTHAPGKMDLRLMSKVFCLFNVIEGAITISKLQNIFSKTPKPILQKALNDLEILNSIESENGMYRQKVNQMILPTSSTPDNLIQFLKASLDEASAATEKWFSKPELSYFESTTLSVKKQTYMERLNDIKDFFNQIQSDIETNEADSMVYFNIQIYPET